MTKLLQKLGLGTRKSETTDIFATRLARIETREAQVRHHSALFKPAPQPQEA